MRPSPAVDKPFRWERLVTGWVSDPSCSPDRLTDREQVALAVLEPSGALAHALAGIVVGDFRESVDRGQTRLVVLLEHHASGLELRDHRLDVVDLPDHLGMRAGR